MVHGTRELRLLDGGDQPQLITGNLRYVAVGRVLHLSQIGATSGESLAGRPHSQGTKSPLRQPFCCQINERFSLTYTAWDVSDSELSTLLMAHNLRL